MAVVVAYRPDFGVLQTLLSVLSGQVAHIYLVDNSPRQDCSVEQWFQTSRSTYASLLKMGDNHGVGAALNAGIEAARTAGATHVLLSDQDSLPDPAMVPNLLRALELVDDGSRQGAIGPLFVDRYTGITYPFQCSIPGKLLYGHRLPTEASPVVEALSLITSGCLVSMAALDEAGGMREDFFIDHVDTEWCHRARAYGWHLYGTGLARMTHNMGDRALRVWFFGWRRETAYPPLRTYYRVRNFIALCRNARIELGWKIRQARYAAGDVYSQVFFGSQRRKSLAMACKGLWHGIRNRMGPY